MLRLNKMTDYAVVVLGQMAQEPASRYSTALLARQTGVPEPTIAKILKDLVKSALITSYRGAQGGYILNRSGQEITIRQIIEAVEGPILLTECVEGHHGCCAAGAMCPSKGNWDRVNAAVIAALDKVTLSDMVAPVKKETFYHIVMSSGGEAAVETSKQDPSASLGMTG